MATKRIPTRVDSEGRKVLDTSTPEGVAYKESCFISAANALYDEGVRLHNGVSDETLARALEMFPILSRGSRVSRSQRRLIAAVFSDRSAKSAMDAGTKKPASAAKGTRKESGSSKAAKTAETAPVEDDAALATAIATAIVAALKSR